MPCHTPICGLCKDYECPGFMNERHCNRKERAAQTRKEREQADMGIINQFDARGKLCDILSLLEDRYPKIFESEIVREVKEWWAAHQRLERETLKREALKKLSAKERRALGI